MRWIKEWIKQRRAVSDAVAIMSARNETYELSQSQKNELLVLRKFFYREKMGAWAERMTLYRIAATLRENAIVVEIGSWVGVSTCYIGCGLRSARGGHIHAVDTFIGSTIDDQAYQAWKKTVEEMGGTTLNRFNEHIEHFGLGALTTPLVASSVEAAINWRGGLIDFLYIDGDHVYESVRADFEAWFPHMATNSIIAFHDYDERHPGVSRLVDEVLAGPLYGCKTFRADALLVVWRSHGPGAQQP
jgi:predicted O-methyltransferase YrrM